MAALVVRSDPPTRSLVERWAKAWDAAPAFVRERLVQQTRGNITAMMIAETEWMQRWLLGAGEMPATPVLVAAGDHHDDVRR